MFGVNFQPGFGNGGDQQREARPSGGSGVQEAIKILSLRLPKVVGAQAIAPMPLLTSQGSGGNPRVDSVVNQVLSRVMPGQQAPSFSSEGTASPGQMFRGDAQSPQAQSQQQRTPWVPPAGSEPRVIFDSPFGYGDTTHVRGGRPVGRVPGMVIPLPDVQFPQLPQFDQPIFRRNPPAPDYQDYGPPDQPLF